MPPRAAEAPAAGRIGGDDGQAPVYDLRGLNCPLPVLRTRKRLATMRAGQRLWIETSDPLAGLDIPAFCNEAGHVLVETHGLAAGHRFLIERGPADGS